MHHQSTTQVLKKLKTKKQGLTSKQAKTRLTKNGPNVLTHKKAVSAMVIFLRQFTNSLAYILLIAAGISLALGHASDAIFIAIVLLINAGVGFYQENKVNKSLEELKKMVTVRSRVKRDGIQKEVDSQELVVGDVIILNAGDKVPADCRLIKVKDLKVNEAPLTGESMAVGKTTEILLEETIVAERSNMVFMGTSIEYGWAKAVITATGAETEFGKIVSLVGETQEPKTPLQKKVEQLSRILAIVIVILIAAIVAEGVLTGKDMGEIFIAALALAVSSIPEGLLPATTVVLVFAMRRILKHKAVVKKLAATEGLGSVTTVCTDKTGTLTEGNMRVSQIVADNEKDKTLTLQIASLTNDAYVENPQDTLKHWRVRGYFTDKALLMAGIQAGIDVQKLEKKFPLIEKVNFSSHLRFAAGLRKKNNSSQEAQFLVVGAPEEIIKRSKNPSKKLINQLDNLTAKGLRVVACAHRDFTLDQIINGNAKKIDKEIDTLTQVKKLGLDPKELAQDLTLVGLIALKDPVRKDVKKAMEEIKKAGIRPVIVTGDHQLTAKAVAEELGFKVNGNNILQGKNLAKMTDSELKEKCQEVEIYARALPEHKLRLVKALHRNQEVVAMFGDGVNDAPALKAADIGVAVGSGTAVAKEVADIILLDDNFKIIAKAIEQGRVAFGNIRKIFIFLVADDFTEVLLFLLAMALGLPLPLLAAQILWINLVEDGLPGIALTTEQETEGVMKEKPRAPDEPILNGPIRKWIFAVFAINGLFSFIYFYFAWRMTGNEELTRSLVFALMTIDSLAFAYCVRSLRQSVFRRDIFANKLLNWSVAVGFILLIAAIYVPFLQNFLSTVPISFSAWVVIFVITFVEVCLFEWARRVVMES